MNKQTTSLALLLLLALAPTAAQAQWPQGADSSLQVFVTDNDRPGLLSMVSDGLGGAFLSWRSGSWECPGSFGEQVLIQRVRAVGTMAWDRATTRVATNSTQPAIVSDGAGGMLVVWKNSISQNSPNIYFDGLRAQRFDADGAPRWVNVLPVSQRTEYSTFECEARSGGSPFPKNPVVVPTPDGGAVVTWQAGAAVRAQRFTSSGENAWGPSGKMIGYWGSLRTWANSVSDGFGGAIVVWSTQDSMIAQRIDVGGALLWGDSISATAFALEMNSYNQPAMVSDDSGGVIVAWTDRRDFSAGSLHAQRIDALGRVRWDPGGTTVCSLPQFVHAFMHPVIVSDGAGGAIIAWLDSRDSCATGLGCQVYGQRVSAGGAVLWGADGVPLSGDPDAVSDCAIEVDGAGGAILVWSRWLSMPPGNPNAYRPSNQIWAQRVDANGSPRWGTAGRMVAATAPSRRFPHLVADGVGGAIVAWENSYRGAIEAQRISSSGDFYAISQTGTAGWITAMPNPARDAAMLRLVLQWSGHGAVVIHDLVGRLVRTLFEGDLEAGERWVSWDGRDDDGNRARPGVYFARVTHPGTQAVGRIVLLP